MDGAASMYAPGLSLLLPSAAGKVAGGGRVGGLVQGQHVNSVHEMRVRGHARGAA
jgi:hypothetical protein